MPRIRNSILERDLPRSSHAWRVDRALRARERPGYKDWRTRTNRADYDRYDYQTTKLPTKRQLRARELNSPSAEVALIDEAERFVSKQSEAGRLLEGISDNFYDLDSFIEAVKRKYREDASLRSLVENIGNRRRGWESLFNTTRVQGWLRNNTRNLLVTYLQRRFTISNTRAGQIANRLSQEERDRLLTSIVTGRRLTFLPRARTSRGVEISPSAPLRRITQTSRSGRQYTRTKPQRWTDNQVRFLRNNANNNSPLGLLQLYNITFPQSERTLSSLKNKVKRLRLRFRNGR